MYGLTVAAAQSALGDSAIFGEDQQTEGISSGLMSSLEVAA